MLMGGATVLSIDGVSASNAICRFARVTELARLPGRGELIHFVLMFYGSALQYLWEEDASDVFHIKQGEGENKRTRFMHLLFVLGQHRSLMAVQDRLRESEKFLAFLDDVYVITSPDRVGHAYTVLQHELWTRCHIRINTGKTQVRNRMGERPATCDMLERNAHESDQRARVWLKVLGIPLGHPECVSDRQERLAAEHQTLLDWIPVILDLQCAWAVLLHCASARANYVIRVVRPEQIQRFARCHDEG